MHSLVRFSQLSAARVWRHAISVLCLGIGLASSPAADQTIEIEVIDSSSGRGLPSGTLALRHHAEGSPPGPTRALSLGASGRAKFSLPHGGYRAEVLSPGHSLAAGNLVSSPGGPTRFRFLLDPLEEPLELRPELIAARRRPDATLLQGFVVSDQTGEPISNAQVYALPGGSVTSTDTRGFFELQVPVTDDSVDSGTLVINAPGHRTFERQHLELWPGGDWTYRVRLQPGSGREVVDDRETRRRAPQLPPSAGPDRPPAVQDPGNTVLLSEPEVQFTTFPSNATVRIPRNIRVLRADGVTVDYVTLQYYNRCVLPSEWIPSWASYAGGTNSLNAGAVATRCYAIGRLNNATATSTYDICATTSCQVYDPTKINSLTDVAVNYTANYLLLSGTAVATTEYSAENNSYDPALTFTCPDGFTAPTGGCLYDPICTAQVRYGHGRGLCQWGSARWATGRRMANRSSADGTASGYPRRGWLWILNHYYPGLSIVKGAPLIIGDDVRALKSLDVRGCGGGEITNGTACALVTTKPAGATGTIIGGPAVVTADGKGFTWYQVQWSDGATGWSVENYLDRSLSPPPAPNGLAAAAASTTQINASWVDTSDTEAGFRLERAPAPTGPWIQVAGLSPNTLSFSDKGLYPGATWYYRVQSWNAAGASAWSGIASATTAWVPPAFNAVPNQVVPELTTLSLQLNATASDQVKLITDFEPWLSETANGTVLFRTPRFSGSTSAFLDAAPDLSAITDTFPVAGHGTGMVMRLSFSVTNAASAWVRLTTASTSTLGNPVIDFTKKFRLDVYSDRPIALALGCRETTTAAGTAVGADGGTTGSSIEWLGVSGKNGTAPIPTRTIQASNWTTLTFDLPNEPAASFSGGNGVLSTASGLGVLEHLAIVPQGGTGTYNLYLDNLAVVAPGTVSWSTAQPVPAGLNLDPASGLLTWTPSELQGPSTNLIAVVASDSHTPQGRTTNLFTVTVAESNRPPTLTAIPGLVVHAGSPVMLTATAADSDLPANLLTFTLLPGGPPSATLSSTGIFVWNTSDSDARTTNSFTIQVTDNGTPPLADARSFSVAVLPRPQISVSGVVAGTSVISWAAIPGKTYRLESKEDLTQPSWTPLAPDITASSTVVTITNAPGSLQKFFRIQVVD